MYARATGQVPGDVKEAYARLVGHWYRKVKTEAAGNFQNVAQQKYGDTFVIFGRDPAGGLPADVAGAAGPVPRAAGVTLSPLRERTEGEDVVMKPASTCLNSLPVILTLCPAPGGYFSESLMTSRWPACDVYRPFGAGAPTTRTSRAGWWPTSPAAGRPPAAADLDPLPGRWTRAPTSGTGVRGRPGRPT